MGEGYGINYIRGGKGRAGVHLVQNIQRHLCDHAQLALLRDSYAEGFGYGLLQLLLTPDLARRSSWHFDARSFVSAFINLTGITPAGSLLFGSCIAAADHGSNNRGGGRKQERLTSYSALIN